MKLYYSPGACSLAPHIVLRELGLAFDLERVDLATKVTETGADYRKINPMGYVPALTLDDGEVLTEAPAILQYLADEKPEAGLAPSGGLGRARLHGRLTFLSAELHKSFSPLFRPLSEEARAAQIAVIEPKLDHVEGLLSDGRPYLTGDQFTVADAYLFAIANWITFHKLDIDRWPHIKAFVERVGRRDAVRAAMSAEGLA